MIPLTLPAQCDGQHAFVTRLRAIRTIDQRDSWCVAATSTHSVWCGNQGLFQVAHAAAALDGDVVLVQPREQRVQRLLRAGSPHNSLLVTERCDQLCLMCSQPPKKTHEDRFALLREACLLAEAGSTIGITGGEPTLYREALFGLIEAVLAERPDLSFHVLTNGQHFEPDDVRRMRDRRFRRVVWGIPLYAPAAVAHDEIVGKAGAFERLHESFEHLLLAAARIELRTVLLRQNLSHLPALAEHVGLLLPHIEQWSLMGLENIGFARNRWADLHVDVRASFDPIGAALDLATLRGITARLFNVPLCQVPEAFRAHAVASISDWKQRFATACDGCRARPQCSGFFEWHPEALLDEVTPL